MTLSWLVGVIVGDGHIDDRHVEIYNSSPEIIRKALKILEKLIERERIVIDIYSTKNQKIPKFSRKFTIHFRKSTSPWNFNRPKIRIRVSSKALAEKVKKLVNNKPQNIREYIKGLFDAEASVDSRGRIEFKQKYSEKGKKITLTVWKYLNKLKIKTTRIHIKKDNLNKKKDIYFYVTDSEKYERIIGFTHKEKARKLKMIIKKKKRHLITRQTR
jgi:hypothetical protein